MPTAYGRVVRRKARLVDYLPNRYQPSQSVPGPIRDARRGRSVGSAPRRSAQRLKRRIPQPRDNASRRYF
jgi:hypothetical protein